MKSRWQLLLIAIGLVIITLSPTQSNVYFSLISGGLFVALGLYLLKKHHKKR
ncbi:hypothetical protein ACTQ45_09825 [Fundicoccus sp. Sow4_D5]|uniref:hypothetical protein n=1 Tax=Fundicoccus sp. Sow4_D5 TaxID=3438782 RepID=UPI003F8F50E0